MSSRLAEAQRQHWLAVCHMLMATDPATADGGYAIYRGAGSDFEPGWNRRRFGPDAIHSVLYTRISHDGGTTTPVKPDVDDASIHDVDVTEQPLEERELWKLLKGHAGQMVQRGRFDWPQERIQGVLKNVVRSHDRAADFRQHQRMFLWYLARATRSGNGEIADPSRRDMILDVTRAYLAIEVSGYVAAQLLAVALIMRRVVPGEPIEFVSREEVAARIDRVCDLVYRLLHHRDGQSPDSYYRMTFLACLYGSIVPTLAQHQSEALRGDADASERLARQAQLAEEEIVHNGFPTFVIPALLADPDHGIENLARAIGTRPLESIEIARVAHPAVQEILERWRSTPGSFNLLTEYYDLLARPSDDDGVERLIETTHSLV